MLSSGNLKSGETYTLYVNDTESSSLEITEAVTSNANAGFGGGKMNKGGMGGGGMTQEEMPQDGTNPSEIAPDEMHQGRMEKDQEMREERRW